MTGLELIKAPITTAGEIADIISEHCPPVVPANCDHLSCRECWLAWLTTGEPQKEKGPSDDGTTPSQSCDTSVEQTEQNAIYRYPETRELRAYIQGWQGKNRAPYSALKLCLEAVLAEEEKKLKATSDRQPTP